MFSTHPGALQKAAFNLTVFNRTGIGQQERASF
jgi:hypothetical protein